MIRNFTTSARKSKTAAGTKAPETFQRGIAATLVGLMHTLAGFFGTLLGVTRILIIGFHEPFRFSTFNGAFNLSFETLPVLLWLSGLGILRSKKWGVFLGAAWALLSIIFHIAALVMRKYYWGIFAAPPGWGEYLLFYYSTAFIAVTIWIFLRRKR